jgi:hypothetical protein
MASSKGSHHSDGTSRAGTVERAAPGALSSSIPRAKLVVIALERAAL